MASAATSVPVVAKKQARARCAGGPRWLEKIAEALVKLVSLVSIASVILILVFVGKEALPVLTSAEVHKEVTFGALFGAYGAAGYVWQPVSEVPKYSVVPLFVGTLKVTLVALVVAVPLSVGAAIYVSEFAPQEASRLHQAGHRASGRHPVGRRGLLRAHRPGDLGADDLRHGAPPERPRRRLRPRVRSVPRRSSRSPRTRCARSPTPIGPPPSRSGRRDRRSLLRVDPPRGRSRASLRRSCSASAAPSARR